MLSEDYKIMEINSWYDKMTWRYIERLAKKHG
jgi:hypothetical protein